jgi:hypothetical protein
MLVESQFAGDVALPFITGHLIGHLHISGLGQLRNAG